MIYLIDGYNLLFYLIDSTKSLQSQRQVIIRSLQEEFAALDLEGMIVFDGSHVRGGESGLSYKSPLVIAYSFSGETADQYILEKIETSRKPSELTVVSNDKRLTAAARSHGAHTINLKDFADFLKKKHGKKTKQKEERLDQRPFSESKRDLERLLKIFEERLGKDDTKDGP